MGTLHDGASGESRVTVAMSAPENAGTIGKTVGFARRYTELTDEPIAPSGALKISRSRRFAWKQALELGKRVRERQFVSIKHVNNHDRSRLAQMFNLLHLVGLGDNRISTVQSSNVISLRFISW
jgi:hypothetical protein